MHHHGHVISESVSPRLKRGHHISKMLIISLFPHTPGCDDESLHEQRSIPGPFPPMNEFQPALGVMPAHPNRIPTLSCEWAFEEQVGHYLFWGVSQSKQVYTSPSSLYCLLLSMLRVFSRSANSNQAKTFHLFVHLDSQIQGKTASTGISLKQNL